MTLPYNVNGDCDLSRIIACGNVVLFQNHRVVQGADPYNRLTKLLDKLKFEAAQWKVDSCGIAFGDIF